jgi:nicotinamidase-related amidase
LKETNKLLSTETTALVLIDVQGKLWNVMFDKEALLDNLQKLVKGLRLLGVPAILTEQNPRGLGPTVPELMQLLPESQPLPKFCFSCWQDSGFHAALAALKRKQLLVCGIEAHICVYQTGMELLKNGYEVQVLTDGVSSRTARNRNTALARLQSEGAKLSTVEMALFELLRTAESPSFKELSRIIK